MDDAHRQWNIRELAQRLAAAMHAHERLLVAILEDLVEDAIWKAEERLLVVLIEAATLANASV